MKDLELENFRDAALYVRVSTIAQDELSPDAQIRLCLDYAKNNGFHVAKEHIYEEHGISGRKADKRPEFQRMICAAKSEDRPFSAILVWKFSRFARNQEESIVYKSMLKKKCNVDVISVSEPVIDGPFGSLIERIIEWMDEYYSIRLSGEVTRGMTEKALRGGYQSMPPLGYHYVGYGIPPEVVPEEAAIVKFIFNLFVNQKFSIFAIARELNRLGYKTSRNKFFDTESVKYILQNHFYYGAIRWNRFCRESRSVKPREEWIIVEGKHEPIISKELFDQAQELCDIKCRPKGSRPSCSYKHWLSGLVKCPFCGHSLVYTPSTANGKRYFYFVCSQYKKGTCLGSSSISVRKLEKYVLSSICDVLSTHELSFRFVPPDSIESPDRSALLLDSLKRISQKESRIRKAFMDGIDTIEEYKENKSIIAKERASIQKELDDLKKQSPPSKEEMDAIMFPRIRNVYDILTSDADTATKSDVLRSVVEKVVYNKKDGSVKIFYIYRP